MTRLEGQDWLTSPATAAVFDALEAVGGPDCARFVGGSVRNALVGRPVDDFDIATRLRPEDSMAALKAAGIKVVPTGLAHGTVTAVSEKRPYEVTTLRKDVETDGRHAVVAFTDDWAEDAARRDFRLNALYADRTGAIFDPTGQGVEDALAGRVVFVGDPNTRIEEDYLRILRFFRFFAWYGRSEPDPEGLAACAAHAEGLTRLSAERVSKELLKLLAAPDPRPAVHAMAEAGVLIRLFPAVPDLAPFDALCGASDDPVLRLSALLPDDPAAVAEIARVLRLPKAVERRLAEAAVGPLDPATDPCTLRALIYREGAQAVHDRIQRGAAVRPGSNAAPALTLIQTWPAPRLPVGGRDLTKLGIDPGPEHGRILNAFEAEWIADDFPADGHAARLSRLARP
ncbi:CCA tRNA nucleotidyltransferase [Brevundimonas sp. NIBR11]|uniref:CCA tRNA nucleotidyltransferase n=1 Tax=Brevundimonas sp. NIBR11 TaxID=3015999 RepID=UPI0022F09EBA|nr:CCA tRNA nucleotidyltransferase [Brevundimonas sp. NIBR11]WGM30400.1 CCA-adding enzyme [Brevundimonas sp. NIBR11]